MRKLILVLICVLPLLFTCTISFANTDSHVHDKISYKVLLNPTYFNNGLKLYSCSCGEPMAYEVIPKKKAYNKWIIDRGNTYYFNQYSIPVKNWHKLNRNGKVKWHFFNNKGILIKSISKNTKNEWIKVNSKKYYFGKWKKPVKGFNFINNSLYYMNATGKVVTKTFTTKKGETYHPNSKGKIYGYKYYTYKYKNFIYVDISEQTLWFQKHKKLKLKTVIVTGTKGKNDTPTGWYNIKGKYRNVRLKGPTWDRTVKYWMPFIGSSYGIHDAGWRNKSNFKNVDTYKKYGSHGCINLPPWAAKTLYYNVKTGTRLIIEN